jgi:hypothetical protein
MKRFYIGRLMAVLCAEAFLGSPYRTTMAMSSANNNDNEEPPRNPYLAQPDANGNSNLWFHTITQTGKLLATDRGTTVVNTGAC